MKWPTLKTYDRVDSHDVVDGRGDDFERSYLGVRFTIGLVGMALPILLVVLDAAFLDADAEVRGSMSAYYHSPVRDLFVGGLAACGVILISYLWWRWNTWDFWISLAAGVGVLGVAAFPTGRAGVATSPTSCEAPLSSGTPPCVAIQELWGEGRVEFLHFASTGLVVVSFAALCLVFALRDFGYGVYAHEVARHRPDGLGVKEMWRVAKKRRLSTFLRRTPRTVLYLLCFVGVVAGAFWALAGPDWLAPNGYAGEFVAFTSFGLAWMIASWDLLIRWKWLRRVVSPIVPDRPA